MGYRDVFRRWLHFLMQLNVSSTFSVNGFMKAVKVFISYAHESDEISNAVLDLANGLREKGVDAEIDQYEEAPPEGWPKWMMRQVQQSDYVIVVCTALFFERANDFSGSQDGLGVKWETSLILQQLYSVSTNNTKFIPVVLSESNKKFIPLPLQPYTYYDVSNGARLFALVDRVKGVSKSKRPPIGGAEGVGYSSTSLPPKERKTIFLSSVIDLELWNAARWKGMAFISDASLKHPPVIGFVFEDNKKGAEIFAGLRERFGAIDRDDEIRISFISGISEDRPLDYKVQVSTDWDVAAKRVGDGGGKLDSSLMMFIGRIHEMNPPPGSKNLEIFKHSYSYFGRYMITNFELRDGVISPDASNFIEKRKISFRQKSEIVGNRNDPDYVVFASQEEGVPPHPF